MQIEMIVGDKGKLSTGATTVSRSGAYAEQIVNDVGLGRFFETARYGKIFSLATAVGATLNGNASPLAAGGTPVWAIRNPVGNTTAAVILKATCMLIAGASATQIVPVWDIGLSETGLTALTGAGTIRPNIIGGNYTSTMVPYVASALTARANASVMLRPWEGNFNEPRHAGAASETGACVVTEETDGRIIVLPGTILSVGFNAAGAAVTGCVSVTWAEIPAPVGA